MLRKVLKVRQIQAGRDVLRLDRDVCEVQGELGLHTGRERSQAERRGALWLGRTEEYQPGGMARPIPAAVFWSGGQKRLRLPSTV